MTGIYYREKNNMDEYATHLPMLAACIAQTKGPVLELGMGSYSTALIHAMCKDRVVVSVDHDHKWLSKYAKNLMPGHSCLLVGRDDHRKTTSELAESRDWGVVFIDHIHTDYRQDDVIAFQDKAELIVVHDTTWESAAHDYSRINEVLKYFPYKKEYRQHRPYTSVLSKTNSLPFYSDLLSESE